MYHIYIKFSTSDKIFLYKMALDKKFLLGYKKEKRVIIDTGQFIELARIVKLEEAGKKNYSAEMTTKIEQGTGKIMRILEPKDKDKLNELRKKVHEYIPICEKKISKYKLDMKIFAAELSFDEKKLTFYFGAESRVDFRELVMDLIKTFKKMIRLQQIGARDQAKICGGFGFCGRKLCCKSFLHNVESITLDKVKLQDLSSGVGKISGVCGKLMCCLEYEYQEYARVKKKLPKIGTKLRTKSGKAEVIGHNIFNESVIVEIEKDKRVLEVKL